MKLRRLLNSLHRFDLRQDFVQQSGFVEKKESPARLALGQHLAKLISNPLPRHLIDLRCQLLNRLRCFGLDGVAETRRKADSAQHSELVFGKAALRVSNGSNDPGFEIFASADKIQDLVRQRIEQQAVD